MAELYRHPYEDILMGFRVMAERCGECLYGPNKIVSNQRRAEILRGLERDDDYFICHKASLKDERVACRGDFEQRQCGRQGRMAVALGIRIIAVSEAELAGMETTCTLTEDPPPDTPSPNPRRA